MREPESFDAFYARTVRSVTSQVHTFIADAEEADSAVREAYARAFQQWYEVSGYRDAEGWVVDAAKDSYQRRGIADGASNLADDTGRAAADGARRGGFGNGGPFGAQPLEPISWPELQQSDYRLPAPEMNLAEAQSGNGTPFNGRPGSARSVRGTPGGDAGAQPGYGRASRPPFRYNPRARRAALAITAAVLVLLAVGGYLVFGGNAPAHTSASKPPPVTVQHKKASLILPAGKVGNRASIPWSLVGSGWTLTEVSDSPPNANGGPAGGGSASIYLVDPKGGRYTVDQVGAATLVAWSGDGTKALLSSTSTASSGAAATTYSLLTVASGQIRNLALAPSVTVIGFTRPNGEALVAVRQSGGKFLLQRYNLAGHLQATIGKLPRKPALPVWRPGSCGSDCGALSSPNGLTDVWGTTSNEMQLVSNTGGVIHRLHVPGSGKQPGCAPLSWWDSRTVLANCTAPGQPSADSDRLWLVPADGSTPTPLTQGSGLPTGVGFAVTAAQAAGTVYVTQTSSNQCPAAASGPGGLSIMQVGAGGALSSVTIPGSTNTRNTVLAAVGSRLLVLAQTKCPGSYSLLWFQPSNGTTQVLLAASAGQLGVTAAIPYGTW